MIRLRPMLSACVLALCIPAAGFAAKPRTIQPEFIGGPLPTFDVDRETKEGKILLAAHVDERGYVQHVEVRNTTNPTLVRPCTVALLNWRFSPARINGQPVPCVILQRFNFDDEFQR